jgi:mannose-6-phosphate isomerase
MTLYPFTFQPLFKERVWGGRTLEALYHKRLPPGVPIGESWEVSDRPGDESVIANGPLAGRGLRWLMEHHARDVLGSARPTPQARFPLLCKILDAREKLSLQVHPPASRAADLGGEPKTEMWFIADADPGAELFVGLRRGVTRSDFEAGLASGSVADCFHRVPVTSGDTMFLPSGRVHAIGAGLVIFEIQQSSDTTYRVFDWNRLGLDRKPRDLHVAQSLASIDFTDIEPALVPSATVDEGPLLKQTLVRDALFDADLYRSRSTAAVRVGRGRAAVVALITGHAVVSGSGAAFDADAGQFYLIPASTTDAAVTVNEGASVLVVEAGE